MLLALCAASTDAQAVKGICSGSICGSSAPPGSDAAREKSKLSLIDAQIAEFDNRSAKTTAAARKAYQSHRKVVGEWVIKKNPQVKPDSALHKSMIDREIRMDLDPGNRPMDQI